MKDIYLKTITTHQGLKELFEDLVKDGKAYHPEDDAWDLVDDPFTKEESIALNARMEEAYRLPWGNSLYGGDATVGYDCPCDMLISLESGVLDYGEADQ